MWKFLKNNIYFWLMYRIVLLILLYTACRLLFYFFNTGYFEGMTTNHMLTLMWAGFAFDISAICYINSLYIFGQILPFNFRYRKTYQKGLKILYCVSNSLFFFFNCTDFALFRFTLRRTTMSVFSEFTNDAGNGNLLWQLIIDYWWILFIWIIISLILVFAYGKKRLILSAFSSSKIYIAKQVIAMVLVLGTAVIAMRGGLSNVQPIDINHAALKINKPIESNIVLNTSFTLIRTSKQKPII